MTMLFFVNKSRTGRAWRALREDPLAAEVMTVPVNRLKLLAFMFGAATAGFTGTIFGAVQSGAFPGDYDVGLLITIYAIVILGGLGSIGGVVIGALIVNGVPELLRSSTNARFLFYGVLVIALLVAMQPWYRAVLVLLGTIAFGAVVHAIAGAAWSRSTAGHVEGGGTFGRALDHWVLHPDAREPPRRLGIFRAHRRGAPAHARARLVARDPPDSDALSGGVRLGEQARRAGFRCDATDHARRTPRRDHERAAVRDLRDIARGGRLTVALLELRGVSKAFGGLQVVNDLELHVGEGEIVSVIGPNGAGKTTIFNLITGIFRPDSGTIVFEDGVVSGLSPHTITTRGIARTFQTLRLFLNMTVLENVMVAAYGHTRSTIVEAMLQLPRSRREEKEIRKLAEEKLAFFGQRLMGYRWDQPAYSLSYANRRRLEIARAMATGARLLLLDEPAAGMNPVETHEITELIAKLRDDGGYTILVIEHDMHVVEGISDRVVALDYGQ